MGSIGNDVTQNMTMTTDSINVTNVTSSTNVTNDTGSTATTSNTITDITEMTVPPDDDGADLFYIMGGVIGGIVALVLVIIIIYCILGHRRSRRNRQIYKKKRSMLTESRDFTEDADANHLEAAPRFNGINNRAYDRTVEGISFTERPENPIYINNDLTQKPENVTTPVEARKISNQTPKTENETVPSDGQFTSNENSAELDLALSIHNAETLRVDEMYDRPKSPSFTKESYERHQKVSSAPLPKNELPSAASNYDTPRAQASTTKAVPHTDYDSPRENLYKVVKESSNSNSKPRKISKENDTKGATKDMNKVENLKKEAKSDNIKSSKKDTPKELKISQKNLTVDKVSEQPCYENCTSMKSPKLKVKPSPLAVEGIPEASADATDGSSAYENCFDMGKGRKQSDSTREVNKSDKTLESTTNDTIESNYENCTDLETPKQPSSKSDKIRTRHQNKTRAHTTQGISHSDMNFYRTRKWSSEDTTYQTGIAYSGEKRADGRKRTPPKVAPKLKYSNTAGKPSDLKQTGEVYGNIKEIVKAFNVNADSRHILQKPCTAERDPNKTKSSAGAKTHRKVSGENPLVVAQQSSVYEETEVIESLKKADDNETETYYTPMDVGGYHEDYTPMASIDDDIKLQKLKSETTVLSRSLENLSSQTGARPIVSSPKPCKATSMGQYVNAASESPYQNFFSDA